jgi:hypothetical protein
MGFSESSWVAASIWQFGCNDLVRNVLRWQSSFDCQAAYSSTSYAQRAVRITQDHHDAVYTYSLNVTHVFRLNIVGRPLAVLG